jgi:cold shock CspA family protein
MDKTSQTPNTGWIKYVDPDGSYGYIKPSNSRKDVRFFTNQDCSLAVGATVSYEIRDGIAINVRGVARNTVEHNTEDAEWWYEKGEEEEKRFIETIVPRLNRHLVINREKKADPTAIDLYDLDNDKYADLKRQTTPYFSAGKRDPKYDPQYTVTINKSAVDKYTRLYSGCDVYFWVEWNQLKGYGCCLSPMRGVWVVSLASIVEMIDQKSVSLHSYENRKGNVSNSTESYLLDLRDDRCVRLL